MRAAAESIYPLTYFACVAEGFGWGGVLVSVRLEYSVYSHAERLGPSVRTHLVI